MIQNLLKTTKENNLKEVDKAVSGSWVNVVSPTKDEIGSISENFKIPLDVINDMLDINERPRIERENDFIYMVIRVPEIINDHFRTVPIGIIITNRNIISISPVSCRIIRDFVEGRVKNFFTSKRTRLLLQFFERSNFYYMKYLAEINKQILRKEFILKKLKNDDILKLVELEKSLLYFSSAVAPNVNVMEKITSGKLMRLYRSDEDILDDIVIDNKQTIGMIRISIKNIRNMREAYSSILTNNLNKIVKFLTSFTIILTVGTLISSIYGMNVSLPLQNSPSAFNIIMGATLLFSLVLVVFFYKKEWL